MPTIDSRSGDTRSAYKWTSQRTCQQPSACLPVCPPGCCQLSSWEGRAAKMSLRFPRKVTRLCLVQQEQAR